MNQPGFDNILRAESTRAVRYGAFYLQFIIAAAAVVVPSLGIITGVKFTSFGPLLVLLAATFLVTMGLYLTARGESPRTRFLVYLFMLLLVCLPSAFLIAMDLFKDGGTAAFYVGPVVMAHFPLLVLTGLFFNFKFSTLAGLAAALTHLFAFSLSVGELRLVQSENAELLRILSGTGPNLMRVFILIFTGLAVGVVSRYARRLLIRVKTEQEEKDRISQIFGEYVSEEVREKITDAAGIAQGQLTRTVILFSDLRGFTGLSEKLAPDELVEQLNLYFDAMVSVISKNQGVVDKFIGDAIMATFGAMAEIKSPCELALQAAREMLAEVEKLNANFRAKGKPELRIGIGMHYAEVLQGVIGSRTRKEYTVIGDGVNIAARLEAITKDVGHPVIFSEDFQRKLESELESGPHAATGTKSLGRIKLKGKTSETAIFTVDQ